MFILNLCEIIGCITKLSLFIYQLDWNVCLLTCTFQDSDLLTFNISAHHSWWGEHGPGCVRREMPQAPGVRTTESQSYITVMGCLLEYQYIEVAHSGAQILVAVSTCEICKWTCTAHVWTRNRNLSLCTLHLRNHWMCNFRCVKGEDFPLFSTLRPPQPLLCRLESFLHFRYWMGNWSVILSGWEWASPAANRLLKHTQGLLLFPFVQLCLSTPETHILPACTFAHTHVDPTLPLLEQGQELLSSSAGTWAQTWALHTLVPSGMQLHTHLQRRQSDSQLEETMLDYSKTQSLLIENPI